MGSKELGEGNPFLKREPNPTTKKLYILQFGSLLGYINDSTCVDSWMLSQDTKGELFVSKQPWKKFDGKIKVTFRKTLGMNGAKVNRI